MQKWEYKLVNIWLTEKELNALGEDGWEFVEVAVTPTDKTYIFIFKRPKQ
ncbi:MAG TPA: DUF4177 domain-containing protein [Pyrinomonadaceae bacterium]|jgi:hypothetical protein